MTRLEGTSGSMPVTIQPPRVFKAQRAGPCADGLDCGGIKAGDMIVRRPIPAAFDRGDPRYQRIGDKQYYYLYFSHLGCYQEGQKRLREILKRMQEEQP